ncbi:hypothetical protein QU487_04165 [Crenobacter sp. SG2305]|uniref:hypothetical protein n=1 Tax=Crenobacter oryzisoli TaxID=3056844 RepID=UPI0025AA9FF3|nr:hypothetical protein [Crenobacter sp. SG2305]MDN0081949.1 hypothetical protein [Crenobacter sp. SG2305]
MLTMLGSQLDPEIILNGFAEDHGDTVVAGEGVATLARTSVSKLGAAVVGKRLTKKAGIG